MSGGNSRSRDRLLVAAAEASHRAYAPYSQFHVGAALLFADGGVVTGSNVENASYGLTLCAETVAVARAMAEGRRGGLVAVAVTGALSAASGQVGAAPGQTVTPCGRCRQVLDELAALDGADPLIWCGGGEEVLELRLSELLPHAFRKGNLQG